MPAFHCLYFHYFHSVHLKTSNVSDNFPVGSVITLTKGKVVYGNLKIVLFTRGGMTLFAFLEGH